MDVHYRDGNTDTAPCGYRFQKHLRGLDYVSTWNKRVATPVSCLNCLLFHQPKKRWKVPSWQGVGKKAR